ncbi:aromatic acid exporter family protein [Alkalibacter rhizosphaerae]|uniref:Aromatic acid exporter family protein n=1 Tax=Alkalibacter rhizosphaerae TaxID=2815577 RepID=A0A974XGM6_9FIRM|nr:aromatic acid exporter family protein [Alkalibacter rhizosphaerae]QSX09336.1 aromatic acid exporter family protein [Alkalibacter rhizosphaerae]
MMNYKSSKSYRLGMRNLKTAVAVLISLLIGKYIMEDDSFFIVVAAMLSMENSVVNSLEVGKNRVIGTVLGALLGMAFAYWSPGSLVLTSLGIILLIYFLNVMKWNKSIIIASFVFLGIMLNMSGETVYWYAINRTIDTLIGLGVGIAVNFLIFPYSFEKTLNNKAKVLNELIKENLDKVFCHQEPADMEALKEALDSYETELADYRVEIGMKKRHAQDLQRRTEIMEDFDAIYTHLKVLDSIANTLVVDPESAEKLAKMDVDMEKERIQKSDTSQSVYTYHTTQLLKKIDEIEGLDAECKNTKM